jgi:hypothetical protein
MRSWPDIFHLVTPSNDGVHLSQTKEDGPRDKHGVTRFFTIHHSPLTIHGTL